MADEHFSFPVRDAQIHFDKDPSYKEDQRAGDAEYNQFILEDWLNRQVGGGDLWTLASGDLHPTTDPTTLTASADNEVIITVGSGADLVDIDLDGVNGDINVDVTRDLNIGDNFLSAANRDFNAEFDNDFNFDAGRDVNIGAGNDFNLLTSNNANVFAVNNVDIGATQDASLYGNRDTFVGSTNTDQVDIRTTASAPTDGRMKTGSIVFYLDEVGNKLKVRVKYSDGTTFKTGEIALV